MGNEQSVNQSNIDRKKLLEYFTQNYDIAYMANLDDASYVPLKLTEDMKGRDMLFKDYRDSINFFIDAVVYDRDKEMMHRELDFDNIRAHLKEVPSFNIEFRNYVENIIEWNEMVISDLGNSEIAVGFIRKNDEIIYRHLNEKMNDDIDTLLVADLDEELIRVEKVAMAENYIHVGDVLPYNDAMRIFIDRLKPGDAKDFFTRISDVDAVKRALAKENKHTYSFQASDFGDEWIAMSSYVIMRNEDGTPSTVTMGFSIMDSFGAERQELRNQLSSALKSAQSANRKLYEQKSLLDYFVESYSSAYSVNLIDDTYEILHMNHAFLQVFMTDGGHDDMVDFINKHIHPDDRKMMMQVINKDYVINRLRKEKNFTFTTREIFGDEERTMRGLIVRGLDEYHIAVGFMDISEEIRQEKERLQHLQEALSMAQSANKAKTTFLNNMSHDIRTPMNAITGYTELAQNHLDDIELVKSYLKKIDQSSNHLLSLINDILDMSRIEAGNVALDEKKENITEIIDDIKDLIQGQANAKHQLFSVTVKELKNEKIICDKLRLNQVLLNVLSNSIKYTKEGGSISLSVSEKNIPDSDCSMYEFIIEDNGMGMSPEFLETIYDPFTRVKTSTVSGIQGTGLGMAICKNLIDMMGGQIKIVSKVGVGTKTQITFEFKKYDTDVTIENGANSAREERRDFTGKKVLLVEDNELNLEIACELLGEHGFVIDTAEDGLIAVEKMQKASDGDYDIVLMDIQMPNMDGYEATMKIRALGTPISKIPIIAMTANAFEEDRRAAFEAGMNEHITKPMKIDVLLEMIGRFV